VLQLIGRRLILLIPTLLIVTFGVFSLVTLVPGDAATTLAGGENATPAKIEEVREELGLNDPLVVQYLAWLSDAVRLDFGNSLTTGDSVTDEIMHRLPVTLSIVGGAIIIGVVIALPMGLIGGSRPGGWVDRTLLFLSSAGLAIPNFVLAILLINVFAINLGWFDAVGFTRLTEDPQEWLKSLTLPAFALGIGVSARLARQIRAGVVDTLGEPYIRTAWAKGCKQRTVIAKHVFKNAALPAVTVAGLLIGGMIGGTVIIEAIFAAPGVGEYLVRAITQNDLPVIQGVAVMFVLSYVLLNLLVDIIYGWLNPKVQVA
jgi:peptide/nickel transport system permease protein